MNIIITWYYKSFAENLTKLFIYKNTYLEFECLLSTSRKTFERNKSGPIPMDAVIPVVSYISL